MKNIGPDYPQDDNTDPTGFLKRARYHQSKFRAEILNLDCGTYGNYLKRADGEIGKNFYDNFRVFDAVKSIITKKNK